MHLWRDKEARPKLKTLLLRELGERVRKIRKSNGLTQTHIANRMGVSTPVVSELERGQLNPTMNTYFILCAALEIEPYELLADLPPALNIKAQSEKKLT
jgi:transcriptional regulator with XRE-family HTH domain